jgi:hypothetical protein
LGKFEVQVGSTLQTIICCLVFSVIISKNTLSCFNLDSYPFATTHEIVNRLLCVESFCEVNCVLPTLFVVHTFDILAESLSRSWVFHKSELFFVVMLSQNIPTLNLPVVFPLPIFAKEHLICLKHLHLTG